MRKQLPLSSPTHLVLKRDDQLPPISLEDLIVMLEIDLTVMFDKKAFSDRLKLALRVAYQQGLDQSLPDKLSQRGVADRRGGAGSRT